MHGVSLAQRTSTYLVHHGGKLPAACTFSVNSQRTNFAQFVLCIYRYITLNILLLKCAPAASRTTNIFFPTASSHIEAPGCSRRKQTSSSGHLRQSFLIREVRYQEEQTGVQLRAMVKHAGFQKFLEQFKPKKKKMLSFKKIWKKCVHANLVDCEVTLETKFGKNKAIKYKKHVY